MYPWSTDEDIGASLSGPYYKLNFKTDLVQNITNKTISAQTEVDVMQEAVAWCAKVGSSSKGIQVPLLLDSESEGTLLQ